MTRPDGEAATNTKEVTKAMEVVAAEATKVETKAMAVRVAASTTTEATEAAIEASVVVAKAEAMAASPATVTTVAHPEVVLIGGHPMTLGPEVATRAEEEASLHHQAMATPTRAALSVATPHLHPT